MEEQEVSKTGKLSLMDWVKKNKILVIIVAAVLVVAMTLVIVLIAGGSKDEVESINITKSNAPQAVYVQGNDLDFSDGKLTAMVDGEKVEISLNDPEVSVIGYDKNKLGEQTLVIGYKGKTVTFKVTVVPRMLVTKYEPSYFIGESMDLSKGELIVTADNGESTIVALKDPAVTASGFNSSVANAALPITVSYQNYTTTFNVAIYEATEVNFNSPTKKAYKSHDSALSVEGGYIALKNAEYSKYITLTADMVTGFDLSKVTVAHRETPLTQTINVDYCGYNKSYDIQISFSDYSLLHLRASEMAGLEWTGNTLPTGCDAEMGENALEAMKIYFSTEEDISLLQENEMESVAKVATVYGLQKWQTAFATYKDAFYLNEAGVLSWDCSDFNKTEAAYNNILNKDPVLYDDGATLVKIAEEYADLALYMENDGEELVAGELISETLSVIYSPDTIDAFSEQLKLMIDLHKAMKDVPNDWTLDMLKTNYSANIQDAWELLYETEFKATQQRPLYLLVSNWREKKDYFDILYQYYYNATELTESERLTKINAFKDLRLPGQLEELYSLLLDAKNCVVYMQNGYMFETTQFMYSYERALELKEKILANNDEMQVYLYNTLEFDYLVGNGQGGYTLSSFDQLFKNFRSTTKGYLSNFNVYLGVSEYEALWNQYMEVIDKCATEEGFLESNEFGTSVEALLKGYLALTPKQQFAFMCLLQPYYKPTPNGRYPLYTWENLGDGTYHNQFVGLIYTHYFEVLPESTHEIFSELMLATEALANYQLTVDIGGFLDKMDSVGELCDYVSKKSSSDWEAFNQVFAEELMYYQEIKEKFIGLTVEGGEYIAEDLTDAELQDFENLLNALSDAYAMMMTYQAFIQQGKANIAIAFYAPMERVEYYAMKILENEDPRVLRAFYFDQFTLQGALMPDGSEVNFGGSMDFLWWLLRDTYMQTLTGTSYLKAGYLMWDAYNDINVKDFLADAAYMYKTYIYLNLVQEHHEGFNAEAMQNIAYKFHNELNDEQRYFVFVLDSNFRMYSNSFIRFAKECNTEMGSLVEQLMKVEYMYVFYKKNPAGEEDGETYKQMLEREYNLLLEDYAVLAEEVEAEAKKDKPNENKLNVLKDFETYFGEIFEFYKTECEAIKALPNA